ncbi:MAG: RDD family protein, partial [Gemmatimonadetes bacterium]|nr:RDD family protein [Gemmatimonadota bacterium]
GFGWGAFYFTAFVAMWRGRTPGKRVMRTRVIRLDGKPIGWWAAFERFGGYAAGLVTGLLGFAQVFWDRNRQAIHDKISETVVVRERGQPPAPVPAPPLERRAV